MSHSGYSSTSAPHAVLATPRVLIAEDEVLIAEELRHRLVQLGAQVVGMATRGEDILALAGTETPDIVLLDIRLKGAMDGIETAAALRERFDVPVIFLTAHTDDATVARAADVGPYGYLVKPVDDRELKITLAMVLHRHALEREVRHSEDRFETTLLSIGDGVIATDADGRITFINPVAESLTQWARHDALGRTAADVFRLRDGHTGEPLPDPVVTVLLEQRRVTLPNHAHLEARDGTSVPIVDSAAPIRDETGRVRGTVMVFRLENADARTADRLRQAEARLRQAEKLEALGRLAGGVAHDINNMMTVVLGCADLVMDRLAAEDPNRMLLGELKAAANRSTTVVRQLLAFSRKQLLSPVRLDVGDVVAGLAAVLRRLIDPHVEIRTVCAEGSGPVSADRSQLEQVVVNLALNGRDAMPDGGTLTIETAPVDLHDTADMPEIAPGRYVQIVVRDTGVGMDPVTRSQIFEPFFTTKDVGQGTGLGLASVYGTVKQSGGHILVDSTVGHGSTFRVYLPIEPAAAGPTASSVATREARGHETVLLVEDESAVRELLHTYLCGAGYQVLTAADGREALQLVLGSQTPHVDLLVTDVMLPHVNGRALAGALRERLPGLQVLFMSGYGEDHVVRRGLGEEPVVFVEKPFSAAVLLERVRAVLDHR
jgi:two-component system cell cycle sensor histidine kinase/response regulator CckA